MDEKEILEKARRDYPPGTKFISPQDNCVYIVNDDLSNPYKNNWLCDRWLIIDIKSKNNRRILSMGGFLCFNDKWAEIISLPHPKIYELW